MNRRHLLGATTALLMALGLTACKDEPTQSAAQTAAAPVETVHWKMVTTWPKNYPALGTGADDFAKRVNRMSDGRLNIKVYAAGELVPAMEVFDAVSRGTAQMGHGPSYYWKGKVPAAQFFTSVPFGLATHEFHSWLSFAGGMQLWEEAYAPHGVKPLLGGNSGMQMGGWFNKEINSVNDLKGLKIRMPGLGGEVIGSIGATPVIVPGSEVFTALQTGMIDATDWVSPYNDLASGIHKAAKYYYYPSWAEPQAAIELLVNKEAWDALPDDLHAILEEAARGSVQLMLDEYVYHNAKALQELQKQGVLLKKFPDEVIAALREQSEAVMDQFAQTSDLNQRIWTSMKAFREEVGPMSDVTDKQIYNWR